MANDITGNPYVLDTAEAVTTTNVIVKSIVWTGTEGSALAADNDFAITDANGKIIIEKRAAFAGDDLHLPLPMGGIPYSGITVSKLDGGICYLYI